MTPQIDLRDQLDLYNGVRPIRLYHASHSPLRGYSANGFGRQIDFVIVRENCEGYDYAFSTAQPAYVWDFLTYNILDVRRQRTVNLKLDYRLSARTRIFLNSIYNDAFGYNLRLQTRASTVRGRGQTVHFALDE